MVINHDDKSILSFDEVSKISNLSKSTIYRLSAIGKFPPRQKIGLRRVGWPKKAIDTWLDSRELVN